MSAKRKKKINPVVFIGTCGTAPKVFSTEEGEMKAEFSFITNDSFMNKDGQLIEYRQHHKAVAKGKVAEKIACETYSGIRLLLEGSLQYVPCKKEEGKQKIRSEINVLTARVLQKTTSNNH